MSARNPNAGPAPEPQAGPTPAAGARRDGADDAFPEYISTRSPNGEPVSFWQALLAGLAPDGGLYLPTWIPQLPPDWEQAGSFAELAVSVLGRWFDPTETAALVREALSFPVPLRRLSDERYVLELFRGPTLSFKDFGARTMARLMSQRLEREQAKLTILVATSGDTGSAVADGFSGLPGLEVVLLYPKGKVSEVQERQLITVRPGVRSFAVQGTFDDCQRLVKAAFADPALAELRLSSANSINIGRLLPQLLYYLWAVARLAELRGDRQPPLVCVPSGNLGNLTGGLLAERMGLQVRRFIAAHNANDFFPRYLAGAAAADAFPATVATLSNAMDVGAPSNFERLVALLGDRLGERIWATSIDDDATRARIRRTFQQDEYLVCPHTAVGLEAVERYRSATGDHTPVVVLATAHPAKFPEVIAAATGAPRPRSEALERLRKLPTQVAPLEPTPEALREVLLAGA